MVLRGFQAVFELFSLLRAVETCDLGASRLIRSVEGPKHL